MKEKKNIFSFSSINIRSDNNINNKILDLKFPKIKLIIILIVLTNLKTIAKQERV